MWLQESKVKAAFTRWMGSIEAELPRFTLSRHVLFFHTVKNNVHNEKCNGLIRGNCNCTKKQQWGFSQINEKSDKHPLFLTTASFFYCLAPELLDQNPLFTEVLSFVCYHGNATLCLCCSASHFLTFFNFICTNSRSLLFSLCRQSCEYSQQQASDLTQTLV